MAAFAACNQLDGLTDFVDADTDLAGKQVVDVRTAEEVAAMPLAAAPGAVNIPLDELRGRLGELDKTGQHGRHLRRGAAWPCRRADPATTRFCRRAEFVGRRLRGRAVRVRRAARIEAIDL